MTLEFKKVDENTIEELRGYAKHCPYLCSIYSPGMLLMWKNENPSYFTVAAGCLIIKTKAFGTEGYLYPYVVVPEAELHAQAAIGKALDMLDDYMEEANQKLRILAVSDSQLKHLSERYKNYSVKRDRRWADYIYKTEEMAAFAGRRYSGQRNHIKKFQKLYPEAVFRLLEPKDQSALEVFWKEYEASFTNAAVTAEMAQLELTNAKKMVKTESDEVNYYAAVFNGDKIISICYGEIFGDCVDVHIEKSLPDYQGIYPFMANAFANMCLGKATYMNREDDAGARGLRISKTQYHPCEILGKSHLFIDNELNNLVPEDEAFKPEANCGCSKMEAKVLAQGQDCLALTMLRESDSDDYDRLCLNDQHNVWWGDDYKKRNANPEPGYFYRDALWGLETHTYLSLAIRQNGQFIGEIVYFVFDGRGSCKMGWRLLPEFCGKGLAAEAFRIGGDFALYGLGLEKVKAYCFKVNEASYKAILKSMKQVGEDETYYYFERTV